MELKTLGPACDIIPGSGQLLVIFCTCPEASLKAVHGFGDISVTRVL